VKLDGYRLERLRTGTLLFFCSCHYHWPVRI